MIPLLASDSNLDFSNLSPAVVIGAAVAGGLWLLQLAAFAFFTRPKRIEPGPPTMDLGNEPPAVVNLLTNRCKVTPAALPATLLDLAARRHLDIEEYGTEETICRLRQETPEGLLPYERMVYDHLSSLAVDRVVPARALTTGSKAKAASWLKTFARHVVKDARSRGLAQDRWNRRMWGSLRLAAIVASAFVVALMTQAGSFEAGIGVVAVAAVGADSFLRWVFGDQQPTEAGTEAAARWLGVKSYLQENQTFEDMPSGAVGIWDRYMSYAAALGLARAALQTLNMGAEDDHEAWSSTGGQWHVVKVRYPRVRLIWGRPPWLGMLYGLGLGAAGAGIVWLARQVHSAAGDFSAEDATRWLRLGSDIAVAVGVLMVAWGVRTLYLSLWDASHRAAREGVAIRLRDFARNDDERAYFMALDDGSSDRIKAWQVNSAVYSQVLEGERIRAYVTPRLGHVSKVEVLSRPVESPSTTDETSAMPGAAAAAGAAEDLVRSAAGRLIPSLVLGSVPAGSVPDPALLVARDDAASALGEPVQEARRIVEQQTPLGAVRGCQYEASSGDHASLSVFAASGSLGALMTRAGFDKGDAMSGIGDKAFIRGRSIVLEAGGVLMMINLESRSHDDATHTLAALADKAVSRLPKAGGPAPERQESAASSS